MSSSTSLPPDTVHHAIGSAFGIVIGDLSDPLRHYDPRSCVAYLDVKSARPPPNPARTILHTPLSTLVCGCYGRSLLKQMGRSVSNELKNRSLCVFLPSTRVSAGLVDLRIRHISSIALEFERTTLGRSTCREPHRQPTHSCPDCSTATSPFVCRANSRSLAT